MNNKARQDIQRKLKVFKYAAEVKNISKACRYFGISRETYYEWQRHYKKLVEQGLINSKHCPSNRKLRIPEYIEEKIIYLRTNILVPQEYHGTLQGHDIKVSSGGTYYVLKRKGLNVLPKNQRKRNIKEFKRYEKQVPGHRVQIDVKFLNFKDHNGQEIRRYQYTAIDDSTRARALKIYERHNPINAIDFVNYITDRFSFRVHTIQTDNGHEFQAKFHWHCKDLGIRHVYIKPRSPHLNGKVERSHATDKTEFYQLIHFVDDIDITKKLQEWEIFYNCHRPHGALAGKTPFEVLKSKLIC